MGPEERNDHGWPQVGGRQDCVPPTYTTHLFKKYLRTLRWEGKKPIQLIQNAYVPSFSALQSSGVPRLKNGREVRNKVSSASGFNSGAPVGTDSMVGRR